MFHLLPSLSGVPKCPPRFSFYSNTYFIFYSPQTPKKPRIFFSFLYQCFPQNPFLCGNQLRPGTYPYVPSLLSTLLCPRWCLVSSQLGPLRVGVVMSIYFKSLLSGGINWSSLVTMKVYLSVKLLSDFPPPPFTIIFRFPITLMFISILLPHPKLPSFVVLYRPGVFYHSIHLLPI